MTPPPVCALILLILLPLLLMLIQRRRAPAMVVSDVAPCPLAVSSQPDWSIHLRIQERAQIATTATAMAGRPKEGLGNGVRSASALPLPVASKGKRAAREGEWSREMQDERRRTSLLWCCKGKGPGLYLITVLRHTQTHTRTMTQACRHAYTHSFLSM